MKRTLSLLVLGLALAGAAHAGDQDVDKVLGSIHLDAGRQAGNLTTVNGGIHLDAGAVAAKVETVNGSISLADKAHARSLETVNGGIDLDADARVEATVETVNGHLALARGAEVLGRMSNVNGDIRLDAAHVGGGIETVNGDVTLGAGARVEGGLLVEKPNDHSWIHIGEEHKPRIVIGPGAVVQGTLEFRRPVVLYVSDRAQIGPVVGATPVKFSGDAPPAG
ncbi:MAG: hypothetical protein ABFC67_10305 [Mizugakiibacter sp.]|uniref:hypothetical protein n=1 Tax=Mizugakiibacter sp. TaxID=1972610 RepID=UPI0031BE9867|nr:hypothetical protein [Xanthomonadaceae bacterium]